MDPVVLHRSHLQALPEDILFLVGAHLSFVDVLSLKQTCRALYNFSSADYLWHRLVAKVRFPLDIPVDTEISQLGAWELQEIAVRGLRLERNWRHALTRHRRITKACCTGTMADQMYLFPGGQWLLSRSRAGLMALWSLSNLDHVYVVSSIMAPGCWKFTAAMDKNGKSATAVLFFRGISKPEFIAIYTFSLEELPGREHSPHTTPKLVCTIPRLRGFGHFFDSVIYENLVAVTILEYSVPLLAIIVNISTEFWIIFQPEFPTAVFPAESITLYPQHLSFTSKSSSHQYFVHLHQLPPTVLDMSPAPPFTPQRTVEIRPIIAQQQYVMPEAAYVANKAHAQPFRIDHESAQTLLEFCVDEEGFSLPPRVIRHSVDFSNPEAPRISPLRCSRAPKPTTASLTMAEIEVCALGVTGRRAVWIRREVDTNEFTLMKMSSGSEGGLDVGVLFDELALPFALSACQSIAFDENTCRLCLGLYDGDIYSIDF